MNRRSNFTTGSNVRLVKNPARHGVVITSYSQNGTEILIIKFADGKTDSYAVRFVEEYAPPPEPKRPDLQLVPQTVGFDHPWLTEPVVLKAFNAFCSGQPYRKGCSIDEFRGYCAYLKWKG